jgi:hypothetical protein
MSHDKQAGWVRYYRSILFHPLLEHDNTCFIVFTKLLLYVDRNTGTCTTGRKRLGMITNLKDTTAWQALKRLEKAGMVTLSTTTTFTRVIVDNWQKFQSNLVFDDSKLTANGQQTDSLPTDTNEAVDDSAMTANGQRDDTKQEEEEEYIYIMSNQIQEVYDLYVSAFGKNPNQFKLTTKRRAAIKRRLSKGDAGLELVRNAILFTSTSKFHRGENDRHWEADLDWVLRSYEQVEKLANQLSPDKPKDMWEKMKEEAKAAR